MIIFHENNCMSENFIIIVDPSNTYTVPPSWYACLNMVKRIKLLRFQALRA